MIFFIKCTPTFDERLTHRLNNQQPTQAEVSHGKKKELKATVLNDITVYPEIYDIFMISLSFCQIIS